MVSIAPLSFGCWTFVGHVVIMRELESEPREFSVTPEADMFSDEFFEMSLDNVCVAGFDGYFKRVNKSWSRTLGWSTEELLSRPIIEFVHPDDRDRVRHDRAQLKEGEDVGALFNRYLCKDGSFRWFEWRSVAHVDRQLVYAIARDITEQRLASERLLESQQAQEKLKRQLIFADRMASVGTLAAGVAHEINNPLAYITANISLLIEELEESHGSPSSEQWDAIKDMANQAQMGADRIRKIVRGLKIFSRSEEERRGVIEVIPLIEVSINMTFNEIRHRARLVKDFGPIPKVDADDARLGQVFINLLVNAAQALPEGASDQHEIRISTGTDPSGRAVIEVKDTGPGIPKELLDRIFDPFFTTKPVGVGTGLGLSICHTIVSTLGGALEVESEVGQGTTFRVVLPAAEAAPTIKTVPQQSGDVVCASVLVVDDEPAIGMVLKMALKHHEVIAVTRGRAALDLLESGKRFHVIFTDLMMPEMSGMDFFEQLEKSFPEQASRVVFVSGGAFTPGANEFLDRVPNERLDKPFTPKSVRDLVARFAQSKG